MLNKTNAVRADETFCPKLAANSNPRRSACHGELRGTSPDSGVDYAPRYYNLSGFMMFVMAGVYLFNLLYSASLCAPTLSNVLICHVVHRSLVASLQMAPIYKDGVTHLLKSQLFCPKNE